jgi:hypothetical protein
MTVEATKEKALKRKRKNEAAWREQEAELRIQAGQNKREEIKEEKQQLTHEVGFYLPELSMLLSTSISH